MCEVAVDLKFEGTGRGVMVLLVFVIVLDIYDTGINYIGLEVFWFLIF